MVALVTDGAQRPEVPPTEALPGPGTFAGYPEYIMLMEHCWHQDPAARPTFTQVCLQRLLSCVLAYDEHKYDAVLLCCCNPQQLTVIHARYISKSQGLPRLCRCMVSNNLYLFK